MKEKILLSWSGGKDSAMTFHEIQKNGDYETVALLTTVTEDYDRISIHGVRRTLLEKQAHALGIPLCKIHIPKTATNEIYETKLNETLYEYQNQEINTIAYGDLFLEDIKQYRENHLSQIGMKTHFPIWKRDTTEFLKTFIALGFKAIVVCVDSKILDRSYAGKMIDEVFLSELPSHVDPCGENGEFHSFVFDGPIFSEKVNFTIGDVVLRESFYFCDLIPVNK